MSSIVNTLIIIAIIALLRTFLYKHRTPNKNNKRIKLRSTKPQPATLHFICDGDTIIADTANGRETIRVIGIDAPETHHPDARRNCAAGIAATNYARTLANPGQVIWLEPDIENKDAYGRLLRHVWLNNPTHSSYLNTSWAALMAKSGHAMPMLSNPNHKHRRELLKAFAYGSKTYKRLKEKPI